MGLIIVNVGAFMELLVIRIYFGLVWEKKNIDKKFMLFLVLWNVLVVTLSNMKLIPIFCIWTVYLLLWVYEKIHFSAGFKERFVKFVLVLIGVIITETVSIAVIRFVFPSRYNIGGLYTFAGILSIVIALLFNRVVRKANERFFISIKYEKMIYVTAICFVLLLILAIENYFNHMFRIWYALIGIVFLTMLLLYIFKEQRAEILLEEKNFEQQLTQFYGKAYENVLWDIRKKQHDFKNQILAVYGSHKTAKSMDELIAIQRKYCDELVFDDRFEKIMLRCNEPVLAGFLYYKCVACSEKDIQVDYDISVDKLTCKVMMFEVIEILGNFIDNAMEYVQSIENKKIGIMIKTLDEKTYITVSNPSEHMTSEQIGQFFKPEYSTHGNGRGLGLSRVKQICEKYNLDIMVHNDRKMKIGFVLMLLFDENKGDISLEDLYHPYCFVKWLLFVL